MKTNNKAKQELKGGLNYPMDNHTAFCNRCFKFNGKCVNTGTKTKDKNCNL